MLVVYAVCMSISPDIIHTHTQTSQIVKYTVKRGDKNVQKHISNEHKIRLNNVNVHFLAY